MVTVTSNRSILLPVQGVDTPWGNEVNNGVNAQLDLILGATQPITMTSADVTLSQAQWNNAAVLLSGTLTGNHSLILPLNPNSATVAVGGVFVVDNETTGAYQVTVLTAASGSTGVVIPQGARSYLYSDTVNVMFADDSSVKIKTTNGNPTGHIAGTAATLNSPPTPVVSDYSTGALYVPTTTGSSSTAVFTNVALIGAPLPVPQGYLTPTSNTPVITGDVTGATTIYYTPYQGAWTLVHNGTLIVPFQFSQMALALTTSQAANGIYDIFTAFNSGTPVIGTGPSWAAGSGGSVTAGSCARGTGAGGTALTRTQGVLTNAASMSLIWNTGSGNTTITVGVGQGVYLGSIFIDSSAGQATFTRSYGQSRKWSLYNAFNQVEIYLKAGDNTANWNYGGTTFRPANNNTANSLTTFTGLADQPIRSDLYGLSESHNNSSILIGVGWNSTTSASGPNGNFGPANAGWENGMFGGYLAAPSLGINVVTALEVLQSGASSATFFGTEANMCLQSLWRG